MHPFNHAIQVYNTDGTANSGGSVTHYTIVETQTGSHLEKI